MSHESDMKARELARWLREEHEKVRVLSAKVQDKVAIVPRTNQGKWIKEAQQAFEHLRAHLMKHMALEARDGYMVPVVQHRPALSREVDRLAHEHKELMHLMDRIHHVLEEVTPEDRLLILDCCKRIQNFLQYVEHHESDENFLVMTAFTDDIGTKD